MRNREKQRLVKKIVRGGLLNWRDEIGTPDPTAFYAIKNLVDKRRVKGGVKP